ncbi:MAG: PD40 domain-containing protein [Chloroflexi bacterium]|nr:PD40 domain-containing protein [Chloroflexota bacterium]
MSRRSAILVVGGAVGCSLILLCVFLAAMAGYTYFNIATARVVDRIAYVDNDSNIQIVDARGEERTALTQDASSQHIYDYPTWSRDGQSVAFVSVDASQDEPEAILYTASVVTKNRNTVFKSRSQSPFYLYWSPDSQHIGFLAQDASDLSMMLGRADGKEDARRLETGSPFYWSWSPDSRTLLMHIGGSRRDSHSARLALLRWRDSPTSQTLSHGPGEFLAPQYSPDGTTILYAAANNGQDALHLADAQDGNAHAIVEYAGRIAFAWSPDGKKIAWVVTPEDAELPHFGKVVIANADGKNQQSITNEDAIAFFWSPDGQRIAYLTIEQEQNSRGRTPTQHLAAPLAQGNPIRLLWRVVDLPTGTPRTLATFTPTRDFISLLPYFDQYARSLTFWSPDSARFVYTHRERPGAGSVWVADVTGKEQPRRVGDGLVAVWSWK